MYRVDPKKAIKDHASRQDADNTARLSDSAERTIVAPIEHTLSGAVIAGIAQIIEAGLLALLGYGIHIAYVEPRQDGFYIPAILAIVLIANIAFNAVRSHRITAYRTVVSQTGRVLAAWLGVMLILTVGLFFFKAGDMVSRVWLLSWFAGGAVLLVIYRQILRGLVLRWTAQGRLQRRTVIVGGGDDAALLIDQIRAGADKDINLLGLFDDRVGERSPAMVSGYEKLGKVSDLIEFARRTTVDLVIVSMPLSAEKRVLDMLTQLWVLPVDIRLSTHMSKLRFTEKAYSYVGELPVLDMADRPISDWNLIFKWVFDKAVALSALIVLSPIMVITAIAIKLESKGPVFFVQNRHGFNNELIRIYKFRSMRTDMTDASAARLVTKDDPRVTRVGKFIRRTSIDELPQLINVLKGELSVVGPRPHALQAKADNKLYYEAVEGYFARHRVKPGITGWAQVNGWRGETDTIDKIMQRVNHDLYYIEHWSILFDLYIVLMTPISLISKNENAYLVQLALLSAIGTIEGSAAKIGHEKPGFAYLRGRAATIFDAVVALWVFSGFIVLFEPSPYELTFVLVLPMAIAAGMGLYRSTLGLLALILAFTPFALIAVFQVRYNTITDALTFTLVTIFLMVTAYVAANYVAERTIPRMRLIMAAYTAAAVLAAIIGTLAYLGLIPGADLFLRYGRAKATFKDPNVYGPFLILPAMFALQRILLAPSLKTILVSGSIYLILFVGVFVSFSRAAWGHFAASSAVVLVLVFLLEANGRDKVRIMLLSLGGALVLLVAMAGLLSVPAVSELFETRLQSQSYDTGVTGRFGRQGYAFDLALNNPLGLGPGEFRNLRIIEEPHNVYVSVLHVYGWGGGLAFYALIAITLWKGTQALMRPSPYRLLAIPLMATFALVMAESIIIDSDHWRHVYLLIGLIWGVSSAIGMNPRRSAKRDEGLI